MAGDLTHDPVWLRNLLGIQLPPGETLVATSPLNNVQHLRQMAGINTSAPIAAPPASAPVFQAVSSDSQTQFQPIIQQPVPILAQNPSSMASQLAPPETEPAVSFFLGPVPTQSPIPRPDRPAPAVIGPYNSAWLTGNGNGYPGTLNTLVSSMPAQFSGVQTFGMTLPATPALILALSLAMLMTIVEQQCHKIFTNMKIPQQQSKAKKAPAKTTRPQPVSVADAVYEENEEEHVQMVVFVWPNRPQPSCRPNDKLDKSAMTVHQLAYEFITLSVATSVTNFSHDRQYRFHTLQYVNAGQPNSAGHKRLGQASFDSSTALKTLLQNALMIPSAYAMQRGYWVLNICEKYPITATFSLKEAQLGDDEEVRHHQCQGDRFYQENCYRFDEEVRLSHKPVDDDYESDCEKAENQHSLPVSGIWTTTVFEEPVPPVDAAAILKTSVQSDISALASNFTYDLHLHATSMADLVIQLQNEIDNSVTQNDFSYLLADDRHFSVQDGDLSPGQGIEIEAYSTLFTQYMTPPLKGSFFKILNGRVRTLITAGQHGNISSLNFFFQSFMDTHVNAYSDRMARSQLELPSEMIYTAIIGSQPLTHPELQAFEEGFALKCQNGFDFPTAIKHSFPGGVKAFLEHCSKSKVTGFATISGHIVYTSQLDAVVGALVEEFLDASGKPIPSLWDDAVKIFTAGIPLSQVDEDFFCPRMICWAATGSVALKASAVANIESLQIVLCQSDHPHYGPATGMSALTKLALAKQGQFSIHTCSSMLLVPSEYFKVIGDFARIDMSQETPEARVVWINKKIHHWFLVEILNSIGKHMMLSVAAKHAFPHCQFKAVKQQRAIRILNLWQSVQEQNIHSRFEKQGIERIILSASAWRKQLPSCCLNDQSGSHVL
ncbi:hypothetical protein C8J56DRAFT_900454 [Mycena floridula]|nr:hypothetical protein C8J56DRAFT_900454 [Mycena floridula]